MKRKNTAEYRMFREYRKLTRMIAEKFVKEKNSKIETQKRIR